MGVVDWLKLFGVLPARLHSSTNCVSPLLHFLSVSFLGFRDVSPALHVGYMESEKVRRVYLAESGEEVDAGHTEMLDSR